jgi:hypothetical protein
VEETPRATAEGEDGHDNQSCDASDQSAVLDGRRAAFAASAAFAAFAEVTELVHVLT